MTATTMESMRSRFTRVAADLLDRDARTAIVLADIGVSQLAAFGVFGRHQHRAINVGIREQLMISIAAGFALEGFRPIVHSYAPFLVERAFEQIKLDLGHQGASAVLVSIGGSFDASFEGRTHQSPGDVALLSSLPGFRIHLPGHVDEVESLLDAEAAREGSAYIRLSHMQNDAPMAGPEGMLVVVRRGSLGAPLVLAVGPALKAVLDATSGLDLTVAYAATLRPFDAEGLRALAAEDVAVVETCLEGTSLPEVVAALEGRRMRLLALGVPRVELRHYGTPIDHQRAYSLDAPGIRARLEAWLR